MRKLSRREKGLLGLVALAAVAVTGWALRHSDAAPAVLGRPRATRPLRPVPGSTWPGSTPRGARTWPAAATSSRSGRPPSPRRTGAPPPPVRRPSAPPGAAGGSGGCPAARPRRPSVTPSLPPLNLKYIGSVENKAGVKVAVLVTDRREVLTGQAGEVVANRYRIARIGLESVDLEDVSSGQSRRIPLKGN